MFWVDSWGVRIKTLFLGLSLRVFLDSSSFWTDGLNKVGCPLSLVWLGIIQFNEAWMENKEEKQNPFLFPASLTWARIPHLFIAPWTIFCIIVFSGSWVLESDLIIQVSFWVSRKWQNVVFLSLNNHANSSYRFHIIYKYNIVISQILYLLNKFIYNK